MNQAFFYVDGIPTKGQWIDMDLIDDWDEIKEALAEGGYIGRDDDGEPDYNSDILCADTEGLCDPFNSSHDAFDLSGFVECRDWQGPDDDAKIAYMECFGEWNGNDFDERYSGQFDSDAEFAQDMAEQCGDIQQEIRWPYTCIDWEHAARELMYDYCDHNGYYFRNC